MLALGLQRGLGLLLRWQASVVPVAWMPKMAAGGGGGGGGGGGDSAVCWCWPSTKIHSHDSSLGCWWLSGLMKGEETTTEKSPYLANSSCHLSTAVESKNARKIFPKQPAARPRVPLKD